MAIQGKNILKGWFVTLAKPVQEQFWDWIDSFRHKSDPITINDLDNSLQAALQAIAAVNVFRPEEKTYTQDAVFVMPSKYRLVNVAMQNNSDTDMTIEIVVDGEANPMATFEIAAGKTLDAEIGRTFWQQTNINITGIEGELLVLIDRK